MTRTHVLIGVVAAVLGLASVLLAFPDYGNAALDLPALLMGDRRGTGEGPPKQPGLAHLQIPVMLHASMRAPAFKVGERLLVDLMLSSRLNYPISFPSWSDEPNDWNGETGFRSAVNIRREGEETLIFLARPPLNPPATISGYGNRYVQPGEYYVVTIDLSKWQVREGWRPGKYTVDFRMEGIQADEFTTMTVMSKPVTFEIRE